ncbi:MAG: hypothetical protein ABSG75_12080 [Syntrophales bacterium]|jgi:hypothetical protein
MYLLDYFAKKSPHLIWTIALLLNLIVGVIDYLTGYEIRIEVFYLLPIGLLSWLVNRNAGIIMSVVSTGTTVTTNLLAGQVIQNYLVESWNILVHFGFFIVIVYLISVGKIISDKNKVITGKLHLLMFSKFRSAFAIFNKKQSFVDITKYGYEQYQDIVINNVVVKNASGNHYDNETRYNIIQKVLNKYSRPFDILDIGASQGYYSFRAAHDYDCVCVMIEGDNQEYPMVGKQLLDLCKANDSLENIILLNKHVIPEDLQKLSECEYFDVVLALNIIHWLGSRWKEVTDAILDLGNNIIIETPPQEDSASQEANFIRKSIEEYLVFRNAKILGKAPRHTSDGKMSTIYLIESEKTKIERKCWVHRKNVDDHHTIVSSYKLKTIIKKPPRVSDLQVDDWKPGINLVTFLMYCGAYPSREKIKAAIERIQDNDHNDWTVNNMILQGNKLTLIDWNDQMHGSDGGRRCSSKVLKAHLRLVGLREPTKIESYFWNRLTRIS